MCVRTSWLFHVPCRVQGLLPTRDAPSVALLGGGGGAWGLRRARVRDALSVLAVVLLREVLPVLGEEAAQLDAQGLDLELQGLLLLRAVRRVVAVPLVLLARAVADLLRHVDVHRLGTHHELVFCDCILVAVAAGCC